MCTYLELGSLQMQLIKMRSYWIRVGSKSSDWCPDKKRGHRETQMHGEEGHMTMEAEIRIM